MHDTRFYDEALQEWISHRGPVHAEFGDAPLFIGQLSLRQLSALLRRAQQLKVLSQNEVHIKPFPY
jgi:hypothetical protein